MVSYPDFTRHQLDPEHRVFTGEVPTELRPSPAKFERLWQLHPPRYHQIRRGGAMAETNRWQQAYGVDYQYSGNTNRALPSPPLVRSYLEWCRRVFDRRLNGLLLNWYDLALGHNIGRHRDSTTQLIEDVPIVTISFGAPQVFRMRRAEGPEPFSVTTGDGTVVVLPYATNLAWTHEILRPPRAAEGRRISITVRGFLT